MIERRQYTEHGDREIALGGEILRTVVGSGVHGIAIAGTDDHDEMGVFVEPPEAVIGVRPPVDHYVYRTQPEGARSGPGDVDLVMY
ncbi:nucleotidyltransferase domain-containing protein [Natronosporangium hydrolyticum]|uniref:Nucleotidyltransferase domain-containing protein n=1 Tax=Natronosporangium hydrolyticum TaxID=2811111 RepID=A0A895YAT8_9ACTN|nr:nucleotidyltransferase domain-containing protein [Natronosporangium hydrolyticum]